jgi:hypothetical protein
MIFLSHCSNFQQIIIDIKPRGLHHMNENKINVKCHYARRGGKMMWLLVASFIVTILVVYVYTSSTKQNKINSIWTHSSNSPSNYINPNKNISKKKKEFGNKKLFEVFYSDN